MIENLLGFNQREFFEVGNTSNRGLNSMVKITLFRLDKSGKTKVSIKGNGSYIKALHDVTFEDFVQAVSAINRYAIASALQTLSLERLKDDESDGACRFVIPFFNSPIYKLKRNGNMVLVSDICSVDVLDTIEKAEDEMLRTIKYYLCESLGLREPDQYSSKELYDLCRCTKPIVKDVFGDSVFVFGSNRMGKHFGGAAAFAHAELDYPWGLSSGLRYKRHDNCAAYGIETLDENLERVEFDDLLNSFIGLIAIAKKFPNLCFLLTEVGCGIAGWKSKRVAYAFYLALKGEADILDINISIPVSWVSYLYSLPY